MPPRVLFAYGSNMCTGRLQARVSSARPRGIGVLRGHVLRFHKKSIDGSAKADAHAVSEGEVWGVLFDIDEAHLHALDAAEGKGSGYEREELLVRASDADVSALVYRASAGHIDASLAPYTWYRRFVLAGAEQHRLPREYIASFIEAVAAVADPDRERDRKNSAQRC